MGEIIQICWLLGIMILFLGAASQSVVIVGAGAALMVAAVFFTFH